MELILQSIKLQIGQVYLTMKISHDFSSSQLEKVHIANGTNKSSKL